jgi:hypothetical protein
MTLNVHWALFPLASVAVQVTCVVPSGKMLPEAGLQTTVGDASQLSLTDSVGNVTDAPLGLVQSTVTSSGQVIDGAVTSCTVTLNVHWALFPLASVAVQVTCVVPSGKILPEAGLQTTVGDASQSSPADGEGNVTGSVHVPGSAKATILPGQLIVGGLMSCTVTDKQGDQFETTPV